MLAAKRSRASANSTFQRIAGQIDSQTPAAPNRHEWRRFELHSALFTTALGTGVLVGASLLFSGQALAGCVDVTGDPNVVFCDAAQVTTDDTLNVNNATNETDTDERHYSFSADGDIEVEVTEDGDITGFGLAVTTTQADANIDMTHDGTINLDGGVPTQAPGGALVLETNGGDISYTGSGDILTDQDVDAFFLTTGGGGTVTIDNSGTIFSLGGSGIVTSITSDVTIANSGVIESQADIGAGVSVFGVVGNATVDNSFGGSIIGSGATFSSGVVVLFVSGDVVVDNRGGEIVGETDTGVAPQFITGNVFIDNSQGGSILGGLSGITSFDVAGDVTIDNSDGGTIIGDVFHGIHLIDTGGNVAIDNSFGGTIQGDVNGVLVETAGDVGITNLLGSVTGVTGDGVGLTDVDTVDIQTSGDIDGGDRGIFIQASGDVNVTNLGEGTITGGTTGVEITSITGDIVVVNDDDGHIEGGDDGIVIAALGAGNVTVLSTGRITGDANADGTGDGINTSAVNGDTVISANASRVRGGTFGAYATSTGTGTITVTGAGNYRGGTEAGIAAVMTGLGPGAGTDGIVISGTGRTTSTAGTAIIADIQNAANDSDILITRSGAIIGATGGIDASTVGGGDIVISGIGPVTTTTGTGVSATASGGDVDISTARTVSGETGIAASTIGAGTVTVTVAGDVTGTAGDGIVTSAQNGDTEITANAAVTGADDGIDATATGAGDIHVGVGGSGEVTGLTGAGVSTDTATGEATIENAGLIQSAFAAISGATSTVLEVVNQAGGLIQNLSADIGDLAISVTGTGNTEIDNDGTIRGRIELGAGDDTFTNSGLWATTGVSDFGDGNDSVINTGRLVVAEQAAVAEITHLANLESFTNASTGVIDMVDNNAPNVRDTLTIDGVYTGVPGSIIQMDLALVAGNPQLGSDLLILDAANPAQGTSDFLFNIVSTGVTATTEDANRVAFAGGQLIAPVTVVENRGNLTTSSGDDDIPLARSGLINYDLVRTAAAGGDFQVTSQLDAGLAGGLLLPIPATLATVAFTTQRTPNPITATCIDPDNKPNAQGGWVRGLAGEFRTETAGTASNGGVTTALESENRTRYQTLQGGFDHVWCNLGNFASTLHLGVTVGHTWGDSIQRDPDRAAGIFGTDVKFDTLFVGPYAAVTSGNFAAQAALRFDYHSLELSNPTLGIDADGLDVDARGISGSASMSYDFELATLTLTPDVGVNVSKTDIDRFDIAGGTIVLDDLWSVMGHVGVTARTQPLGLADNLFVVPFASATLYHEFIDHADGKIDIAGTVIESESNRVGTFGQLGIGANAVRLGDVVAGRPTLFGGARFDLQVGERIEGATATVFGRIQF